MAVLPQAFSKEALPAQAVPQGAGKWWGRVLVKNTGEKKDTHPNRCALGCGMLWTASGCNASKHIGDVSGVRACSKATDDDKRLAESYRTKTPGNQRTPAVPAAHGRLVLVQRVEQRRGGVGGNGDDGLLGRGGLDRNVTITVTVTVIVT